ncbi:unnamed protein product [Rotaria magnacalcarata]|uniref:Delta(14)-sterol reductase n=2 Tax=Rotaria magnacalcarata TaxID=392030 RepID=A0A816GKX8_9BILA|nr:unnamed protein product [Rotaria magnacalcarata]
MLTVNIAVELKIRLNCTMKWRCVGVGVFSVTTPTPSPIALGTPVGVNQDGSIKRLDYKLSADNFTLLLVESNILSFIIAIGVSILAYQQNNYQFISQNLMYDFWMGRSGLMLWILLNISFIKKQKQNFDGHYSLSIIIITIFQILFVTDYYYFEEAILTTWDIMEEKFGLMMIWGDIVFVPFFFSIQTHYLSLHSPSIQTLSTSYLVFCLCLCISGFLLFRIANLQKHHFSYDSSYVWGLFCYNYFLKQLFGMNRCNLPKYIQTKHGPKILYSGCWGIARRMNLTGDILQSIGWCLLCSFNHFIPYTYIIYLIVCFMHRERRDNEVCQRKFGSDWKAYTNIVQWRFFPNIY